MGEKAYEALLVTFQRAAHEKTPESLQALVAAARRTHWQKLPEALGPLVEAAPECLAAIANPGVSTDAAFVVLFGLINRMEVMTDASYRVEHDQSKNLQTYNALLQRLIDHDEVAEFRHSTIATMRFPLKLASVTQVDSKNSPAVQLADILIGATIEVTNRLAGLRADGLDPEAVIGLFAEDQIIHMLPSLDMAEQREFRQGSQAADAIDYFAANFVGPSRR